MDQKVVDKNDIERQVFDIIASEAVIDRERLTREATLASLEVQSIDVVMILMALEEKFGIYFPVDDQLTEAKNLGEFVDVVINRVVRERT